MDKHTPFLIQRKEKKSIINFHKDIYSLGSIKKTFGSKKTIGQSDSYWKIQIDDFCEKDIKQLYNYLLYLNRKQ